MRETPLLLKARPEIAYSKAFLSLGELIIVDKPTHIWTILGSCVSVILHNPRKKVSALCHAQLSENKVLGSIDGRYIDKVVNGDFRYVACSINYMLDQLYTMGINKSEIYASIYGGANIIAEFSHKIGSDNSAAAINVLEKNGIRILRKDIGGTQSRTIRHFSDTGTTHVKLL
jgi:chemotaxis protein CheD